MTLSLDGQSLDGQSLDGQSLDGQSLEALAEQLQALHPEDRDAGLLAAVAGDLAARDRGFGWVATAPHSGDLIRLTSALAEASPPVSTESLTPFAETSTEGPDDASTVARALAVFVLTSARQLMPHRLVSQILVAAELATPVIVLIEGLEILRDPKGFAGRVTAEVAKALPDIDARAICLGDSRFVGPGLAAAVSSEIGRLADALEELRATRARRLGRWRSARSRSLLAPRAAWLREREMLVAGARTHVARGRTAAEVWTRSQLDLWADHWRDLRRSVLAISPGELVHALENEAEVNADLSLTERMRERVHGELRESWGARRSRLAPKVRRGLEDIRVRLREDHGRYLELVEQASGDLAPPAPGLGPLCRELRRMIEGDFEEGEKRTLAKVEASAKWLDFVASDDVLEAASSFWHRARGRSSGSVDAEPGDRRSSPGPDGSPPVPPPVPRAVPPPLPSSGSGFDDPEVPRRSRGRRSSGDQDIPDEILVEGALSMIKDRLVRGQVESEILRMLEVAEEEIERQGERANARWHGELDKLTDATYSGLEAALEERAGEMAARRRALEELLEEARG